MPYISNKGKLIWEDAKHAITVCCKQNAEISDNAAPDEDMINDSPVTGIQGHLHTDHNDQRCGQGNCKGLIVGNVLSVFSSHIIEGPIGDEEYD